MLRKNISVRKNKRLENTVLREKRIVYAGYVMKKDITQMNSPRKTKIKKSLKL